MHFNAEALRDAILAIPWDVFYNITSPNESLTFLTDRLKEVHDTCVPLRVSTQRRSANSWFNAVVQKSLLERDLAYQDWLRASPETKTTKRQVYTMLRNRANSVIARAKKQHLSSYLDVTIPSKTLWNRVKNLGVGKDRTPQNCSFDPDVVNQVFLANYTRSENQGTPTRPRPELDDFSFDRVEYWQVVNSIYDIKSNAVGMDGLPIRFVKIVLPLVFQHITHLFNRLIETSTFPEGWKHAKVLPLKKKPLLNDVTNLRPISILCALSKSFEKLLEKQMIDYIDRYGLLTEFQAGFRKGQSIKTAVLRVHDDLGSIIDRRGAGILLLLDFSKAFDTIPHKKLCDKLVTQFHFGSSAVNLLFSYLVGRKQTVFCGDRCSSSGETTSGVPQGSVIGPLLFCCHINDLPSVLKHCSIQMYADDVQLYVGGVGPCVPNLVRLMNEDLARVSRWSTRNELLINPSKSKALFVQSRTRRAAGTAFPAHRIVLDGLQIEWTETASNLGFPFQCDLEWDGLVSQQVGKVYASLRTLHSCASAAPVPVKLKLFKALILPHFLFADVFFVNTSVNAYNRLRVALNCCVRYVYGLRRTDHVSHLQKNLVGCPFENFYAHRSSVFLWRLLTSQNPSVLYGKLIQSRGRRLRNLVIPTNRTVNYANSLFVRGVINWNALPPTVKHSTSEAIFVKGCLDFWNRNVNQV